jgi:DNA-binding response OmpR family regulator
VLLVDDDTTYLAVLVDVLSLHEPEWGIRTAHDGAAALEELQEQPADLIVTDLAMPDMDGMALVEALSSQRSGELPPIIVVTGYGSRETSRRLLELGVRRVLSKPLHADALLAAIREELPASR